MEIWGLAGITGTYNKIKKGEFQKLLCSLAGQSITTSPLLCFFFFLEDTCKKSAVECRRVRLKDLCIFLFSTNCHNFSLDHASFGITSGKGMNHFL